MKVSAVAALVASAFLCAHVALAQVQNVSVTGGKVVGVVKDGIASFKGIPFAAPPTGDLRWKAPQPVKPWSGEKKADTFGPNCMQDASFAKIFGATEAMGEDCLYLNVWTPARTAAD